MFELKLQGASCNLLANRLDRTSTEEPISSANENQDSRRNNQSSHMESNASSALARPSSRRTARLYRIRATQASNGKLGPPIRVVELQQSGGEQQQRQFGLRTSSLPLALSPNWPPAPKPNKSLEQPCQQQPANSWHGDQHTQRAPASEAADAQAKAATSIAATSQTLRLFGSTSEKSWRQSASLAGSTSREVDESEQQVATRLARTRDQQQQDATKSNLTDEPNQLALEDNLNYSRLKEINNDPSSIHTLIDDFDSKITTNRSKAQLSCDSGEMILRLNFSEPFRGIVYPDHNRLSPCRFFGDGHHNYELRLPLKGCGTRQVAQRVFVNDVIVRFHKSLELEEDEVKTLICRYPPPMAPPQVFPAGQFPAQGNALLHELFTGDSSSLDGRTNGHGYDSSHETQVDMVDPTTGRIRAGSVALDSLVAPPTDGQHRRSQQFRLPPSFHPNASLATNLRAANGRPNANLVNLANDNRIFGPRPLGDSLSSDELLNGSTIISQLQPKGSASSGSFLDRLSSIELLFLISSLMFLILLALGLAASYYCLSGGGRSRSERRRRRLIGPVAPKVLSFHSATKAAVGPPLAHRTLSADEMLRRQQQQRHIYAPPSDTHRMSGWLRPHPVDVYGQAAPLYSGSLHEQQTLATGRIALSSSSPDDATSDTSGHRVLLPHDSDRRQATRAHSLARTYKPPLVLGRRDVAAAQPKHQHPIYGRTIQQVPYQSTLGRRFQQQHQQKHLAAVRAAASGQRQTTGGIDDQQAVSNETRLETQHSRLDGTSEAPGNFKEQLKPMRVRQWSQLGSESNRVGTRSRMVPDQRPSHSRWQPSASLGAKHTPRLVLQSIDDTFITNITETDRQEYMERDSMNKPLSWADWAAASNAAARTSVSHPNGRDEDDKSTTSSDSNDETKSFHQANLRSLTELDVNFAKSLLRSRESNADEQTEVQEAEKQPAGSPAVPISGLSEKPTVKEPTPSVDLQISPEYDCPLQDASSTKSPTDQKDSGGGGNKSTGLTLTSGRTSPQSHESISYV